LGGSNGLGAVSFTEVYAQRGIGQAKAAQFKAAIELGRRFTLEVPEDKPVIHSPGYVAALVQWEMSILPQEHLRVILLDTRNRVIGIRSCILAR
jgi:DNA repair protein RadC